MASYKGEAAVEGWGKGGAIQYELSSMVDPDFISSIKSKLRPKEDFIDGLVRMRYLDRI